MTIIQTAAAPTPLDLLRAESEGAVEFADGQLWEKPVSIESSKVAMTIGSLLNVEAWKTDVAQVFDSSLGYQCFPNDPGKFRKPDVSVVLTARMAGLGVNVGLMPIPADLAIEVNSPADRIYDVEEKVEEYLGAGFPLLWLVHPSTRTVTIYRGNGSITRLGENDEITGESAIPSFRCQVTAFFRRRRE